MLRLENAVQHYAWGSTDALPALLGRPPDGRPHAELWLGAHPAGPSAAVRTSGAEAPVVRPLDALVADDPDGILGAGVRARFGDRLPYLVKLLAAERALSLQVHPDADRARRRHDEETAQGVPAAERSYPDPWHKPELLVALAPTLALAGLRPPDEAAAALAALDAGDAVADVVAALRAPGPEDVRLRTALTCVLALPLEAVAAVTAALASTAPCALPPVADVDARGVARLLADQFPADRGVVASFLMHAVVLAQGEALFVDAGVLHCYVAGLGLEVMAASDDVLRAGLTGKRVDVGELLAVVRTHPGPAPVLRPVPRAHGSGVAVRQYVTDTAEFALAVVDLDVDAATAVPTPGGPRAVLGLSGAVTVTTREGRCALGAGESVLVPDAEGALRLAGRGTVAVVGVPGAGA
ncbi:mannose-6-phosphate isomerase, class I [Cellulomonas hominis]|uniref:mannose-6-phosphate isomerase, class I n=1 Tax=Cellulomonas hominis TaxID=156981 RepID=UPI001BA37EF9|nr:mannose-6-phosphate isomerase, class I [Cellulomonas hominis]VTR76170.1 Mannose-6-phosphate isomerase [Cellulomonas hominis]